MFVCLLAAAKSVQSAGISQPVRLEVEAGGVWGVVFLFLSLSLSHISSTILHKIGDSRDNKSGLYTKNEKESRIYTNKDIIQ